MFLIDPTINHYKFTLPEIVGLNSENESNEIKETFSLIVRSIDEEVEIPKEKEILYEIILFILGVEQKEEEIILNDLLSIIKSQKEAVSLLSSSVFRPIGIKYITANFVDFVQSDEIEKIDENTFYEVIDLYLKSNIKDDDVVKVFLAFKKDQKNYCLHFLCQLDPAKLNDEMILYLVDNVDDENIYEENPRLIFVMKSIITSLVFLKKSK